MPCRCFFPLWRGAQPGSRQPGCCGWRWPPAWRRQRKRRVRGVCDEAGVTFLTFLPFRRTFGLFSHPRPPPISSSFAPCLVSMPPRRRAAPPPPSRAVLGREPRGRDARPQAASPRPDLLPRSQEQEGLPQREAGAWWPATVGRLHLVWGARFAFPLACRLAADVLPPPIPLLGILLAVPLSAGGAEGVCIHEGDRERAHPCLLLIARVALELRRRRLLVWFTHDAHPVLQALGAHGFPVPRAIEHTRHAVLMSVVDATPLSQVSGLLQYSLFSRPCFSERWRFSLRSLP